MRVIVRGKVQGVWFRDWLTRKAQQENATGWVRNRSDGSLEAVFGGDTATIEKMCQWARKGPPLARVTDIEQDSYDDSDAHTPFQQKPTL
ncbi:MAG: acylphosphatase [Alphaproteobacteria bacterium GM202ARS2]|nr:acylphosphatase [Alphaproteobacteria bacterium GM202ARS2]